MGSQTTDECVLAGLRRELSSLESLLQEVGDHWTYEDGVYRLYHQSFKVYSVLQSATGRMVDALRAVWPGRELHPWFLQIVGDGTGHRFDLSHNQDWLHRVRPIAEAFFHARFMLEMAVKYGRALKTPPQVLPSGWAALLYLYQAR